MIFLGDRMLGKSIYSMVDRSGNIEECIIDYIIANLKNKLYDYFGNLIMFHLRG